MPRGWGLKNVMGVVSSILLCIIMKTTARWKRPTWNSSASQKPCRIETEPKFRTCLKLNYYICVMIKGGNRFDSSNLEDAGATPAPSTIFFKLFQLR